MSDSYDFVVIGGGSAGYAGASTAAKLGLSTVVIEGGAEVGGLCILRGCMPSKAILESAHRAETIRRAKEFGLNASFRGADGTAILERKNRLISEFADYRRGQLESGTFDFVRGMARFIDEHTLEVALCDGGVRRIQGRAFLLATGSRINRVEIPGLEEAGCWDSDQVLASGHIPKSVTVLGGGAIALELASYYAGVGSEVTVIQRGPHVLKDMDADVAVSLAQSMERRGIRVLCQTAIVRAELGRRPRKAKRVVFYQHGDRLNVDAEEIVYALGRRPLVEGLDLEKAGVAPERHGVRVNLCQQSSAPHIFAAGDVCGPFEVVHIAIQQGELSARNAARLLRASREPLEEMDYSLKLFAVFTFPEVAAVGLTEVEAAAQGIDVLTAGYPFNEHGKSMVRGETDGFVKLICERNTRRIVGGAVVGAEASELIHEIVVAMHFRGTAGDLARVPHYHPTMSEIWTYPAEELAGG